MPGLSQSIKVTFKTDKYERFKDNIKIHTGTDSNFVIPLIAYPCVTPYENETCLPKIINLPQCIWGSQLRKHMNLPFFFIHFIVFDYCQTKRKMKTNTVNTHLEFPNN